MIAPRLPGQVMEAPPMADCPRCGEHFSTGDPHRCRFGMPAPPPPPYWPAPPTLAELRTRQRKAVTAAREELSRISAELDFLESQKANSDLRCAGFGGRGPYMTVADMVVHIAQQLRSVTRAVRK